MNWKLGEVFSPTEEKKYITINDKNTKQRAWEAIIHNLSSGNKQSSGIEMCGLTLQTTALVFILLVLGILSVPILIT